MNEYDFDILLIGGGIMSATLAVLLHQKYPNASIAIVEKLPKVAEESSEAWNNAGTGHSGYCELNYTPEDKDGKIDISKALKICQKFEKSMAFWNDCAANGILQDLEKCIHDTPHINFVMGDDNVKFLQKRYEALQQTSEFCEMEFSTDRNEISTWAPLLFDGRNDDIAFAATRMSKGKDVNFGEITDQLFYYLSGLENVFVYLENEVTDIEKRKDNTWEVSINQIPQDKDWSIQAKFVFIGAGGGSLPLLIKTDIPEGEGYGGFPISGQWLRCSNRTVIEQHHAKVYGIAEEGSPPMSVPHLDTRVIDGKKELLFGPFAGFSTKFLKNGSYFDLPMSFTLENVLPMLGAGIHNIPLTKYLIEQVTQTTEEKLAQLQKFYPNAKMEDWELYIAGQRVQVIKEDKEDWGKLEFGTEIIVSQDMTMSALLGASPGASTSYSIMRELLDRCSPFLDGLE